MGLTNFPNGLSSFGMPVIGSMNDEDTSTGNVFFVSSTHTNASDDSDARSPDFPAATIDGGIGKCTADNGDIVFVMPGHDENPLVDIAMDVAGVWVRGLGWGNDRPTITFGATGANVELTAENTRLSNIIFDLGTVAGTVTTGVRILAAGCIVENCEWKPHATSQFSNFLIAVDVEDVIIRNNRAVGLNAAAGVSGITVDGCNQVQVTGNYVSGSFTEHALDNTTLANSVEILRAYIVGNIFENSNTTSGKAVDLDTLATGIFAHNLCGTARDFEAAFTQGSMLCWENYMQDTDDTSGGIIPGTLSTS